MKEDKRQNSLPEEQKMLAAGYVLGDLSDEELAQAEQLLQKSSDFVKEVQALEASFQLLPTALPKVTPLQDLKAQILSTYTEENRPQRQQSSQSEMGARSSSVRIVAIVSTLAAILLGINNVRLYRQLRLARRNNLQQEGIPVEVINALQQPKTRLISLRSEDTSAAGTFLFTPGHWSKEVFIAVADLPPLASDRVYRLWASLESGETFYCGEFNTDSQGSVFVRLDPPGQFPGGPATNVFVTIDQASATPEANQDRVLMGRIN